MGFQLRELENLSLEVDGRWVGFECDGESKLIEEVTIARGIPLSQFSSLDFFTRPEATESSPEAMESDEIVCVSQCPQPTR